MMLNNDQLRAMLQESQKAADCGKWCVVGGEVEDEHYKFWHQGIRDASVQIVRDATLLAMSETALSPKVRAWIESCHKRAPIELGVVAGFAVSTEGRWIWPGFGQDDEQATAYATSAD